MSFRVLSTPYPEISYPSLSRDGNWVAFPSKDPDGLWGVYFMNSASGNARRIATNSTQINSVDISPDGSRVAYTRWFRPGIRPTSFIVSSLGGQPTQLVEKGVFPEWRPDGQRIGYVLFDGDTKSGKMEVWTVRPDGSDNRREYTDVPYIDGGRCDFKWSPDGKSNLWMMPAQGGEAVQITKGSGPDIGMAISNDMKKLLYLQQMQIGNIWSANSDGSNSRQLTFEDQLLEWPEISHDGNKIVYVLGDPDPTKTGTVGNIYVMDRTA